MLPVLNIGSVALPTYPLLLLVATWAGLWLAARRAGQLGLDGDHVFNAGLYGILAGLIGARLWFVLSNWEVYAPDVLQAFSLSRNALAVEEGVIIGVLVALIYLLRQRVPASVFVDALTPGLALALIIGHIGAFLGGEALGVASNLPWAVEMAGLKRHPLQLYEAVAGVVILIILYVTRDRRPWSGFQFWLLVALYSLARLLLEIFRAQPYLIGDHLMAAQLVALAALVVALAVMAYNFTAETVQAKNHETL